MLHGHVDAITRRGIRGWAADDERSDQAVQILIFVDGCKLAQIGCVTPRPDLLQLGIFGLGPHGFAYEFPEQLGDTSEKRVSIRYARTGKLLNRGDANIKLDGSVVIRAPMSGPADTEPEQLPVPRNPKSTFETLALYDEKAGLYDLLSRVPFSAETPNYIHYTVFGRYPNPKAEIRHLPVIDQPGDYSPRDHMNKLLLSQEFQRGVIPVFLNAFPEKKRVVFIHIPKCAGTDLSVNLMKRFPSIHQTIMEESWTQKEKFLQQIARLTMHVRFFDSIFLCGHSDLDYYTSRDLIRPFDRVFTIVRHPVEIAISHVNYILTRLSRDIEAGTIAPDTRAWMDILGLDSLPAKIPPAVVQKLASTILHSTKLVKPNSMCSFLGGANAEDAIAQLAKYNVEVTTVNEYGRWLQEHWTIASKTKMNRSDSFISLDALLQEDVNYIQGICAEDARLYAVIDRALTRSAGASVFGEDLRAAT
jgi:hypothetical protein